MSEEAPRGYFPGSRTPLPFDNAPAATPAPAETSWDARSTKKVINGTEVEFFSIGAVCAALGRPAVTIRLWIRQGHLPAATYRMPTRTSENGAVITGRRLYTRHQVESIVRVAEQHGILGTDRVDWSRHTGFAQDVRNAWATSTNT